MKYLLRGFCLLSVLLLLTPMLLSCSLIRGDENGDDAGGQTGGTRTDAYGFERPEDCWLTECLLLPELLTLEQMFGVGGESGLVSEQALQAQGQIGSDGHGYLVYLMYGKALSDEAISQMYSDPFSNYPLILPFQLTLVSGNRVWYNADCMEVGDPICMGSMKEAALDMYLDPYPSLTVICDGLVVQGAVAIPIKLHTTGLLYIDTEMHRGNEAVESFLDESDIVRIGRGAAQASAEVEGLSVGYLSIEAYRNGNGDPLSEVPPSDSAGYYMVVDLTCRATAHSDDVRTLDLLLYFSDRRVLDVRIEEAPTDQSVKTVQDGSMSVCTTFTLPSGVGERKTVRVILRMIPVNIGDVTSEIFVIGDELTDLTGCTRMTAEAVVESVPLQYTVDRAQKFYTVTKLLDSSLTELCIPDTIGDSIPVVSIEKGCFAGNQQLLRAELGDYITDVADGLFALCTGLREVTLGADVTRIGVGAFYGCSALRVLHFKGTKAQWEAVTKETLWMDGTQLTQVICSDGVVKL